MAGKKETAGGIEFILSGRNAESLAKQKFQYNKEFGVELETRCFTIKETATEASIEDWLRDVKVVLNCAGPFHETADFVVKACLRVKAHYVDITGEIPVFERLYNIYDKQAKDANIMILPGAGFDIVPTDCLAKHLKNALPEANHLVLAFGSDSSLQGMYLSISHQLHAIGNNLNICSKQGYCFDRGAVFGC